jgi:hypothetical protein
MTKPTDSAEHGTSLPPACPRCGSVKVGWILRGLPILSEALDAELASGTVVLGGCVVWTDQASHQCNACGLEFRSDGRPVRFPEDGW